MAWASGTASGYLDLLDKLRQFATTNASLVAVGQAWTVLRWTGGTELILRGAGLAGVDNIYVGIKASGAEDYGNWRLQGYSGYAAGAAFDSQAGAITGEPPRVHLWTESTPYWFAGNGRRLVMVARVGPVYQALYLGLMLPYAQPSQWAYPLVVGGSSTAALGSRWSHQGEDHRHFVDPGLYGGSDSGERTALRVLYGGTWRGLRNRYGTSAGIPSFLRGTWPYGGNDDSRLRWAEMRDGLDGSYPLAPVIPYMVNPLKTVLGELDGVFATVGRGNGPENLITAGGVDHLVVPNVYRGDYADYWALRLE